MNATGDSGQPTWGAVHKLLHWLVAAAVLVQLYLGFELGDLADEDPARPETLRLHATVGLTILVLMVARLAWRLTHPVPPPPATLGPRLARASRAVHLTFYAALLILPVSGLLLVASSGNPVPLAGGLSLPGFGPAADALRGALWYLHASVAIATSILVLVHVGAAVRHAVLRDGTVSRMLPGG